MWSLCFNANGVSVMFHTTPYFQTHLTSYIRCNHSLSNLFIARMNKTLLSQPAAIDNVAQTSIIRHENEHCLFYPSEHQNYPPPSTCVISHLNTFQHQVLGPPPHNSKYLVKYIAPIMLSTIRNKQITPSPDSIDKVECYCMTSILK